ncbi:hypothetical protein CGLO_10856 [Colletotrichum gloeosporioides Cg-14]|uniref:Uncharacterized protein n=1 Tax=Colletotrichum gloeosporioides (strain Cg-14) TaxID=1237896 RepID=T0K9P3_COLGC|nr:hypothetical protein CGLO_10856 [Colletotrichum gloeosporioides Cg-14]
MAQIETSTGTGGYAQGAGVGVELRTIYQGPSPSTPSTKTALRRWLGPRLERWLNRPPTIDGTLAPRLPIHLPWTREPNTAFASNRPAGFLLRMVVSPEDRPGLVCSGSRLELSPDPAIIPLVDSGFAFIRP